MSYFQKSVNIWFSFIFHKQSFTYFCETGDLNDFIAIVSIYNDYLPNLMGYFPVIRATRDGVQTG